MELYELMVSLADPPRPNARISPRFHDRVEAAAWWAAKRYPGDLVEIGAYKGVGTERLALAAQAHKRRVIVVDPWKRGTQNCKGNEYNIFTKRMAPYEHLLDVVRLPSQDPEAVATLKDRELCFVLVDGLHKYATVKSDIAACLHAPVICVDDVAWHRGVRQAFEEAAAEHKLSVLRVSGREAYLARCDQA